MQKVSKKYQLLILDLNFQKKKRLFFFIFFYFSPLSLFFLTNKLLFRPVKSKQKDPLAIILAPNRELVEQVCSEIGKFKKYLPFPSITQAPFCGGAAAKKQLDVFFHFN